MKTARFDTTWYVPETRAIAEAKLAAENEAHRARLALGYLYVIEFASGLVKVGKGEDPKARIAAHSRLAEIHGGSVRSTWISRRLVAYAAAERDLIRLCSQAGRPAAGREYFDLSFKTARLYGLLVEKNRFAADDLPPDLLTWLEAQRRANGGAA